ncbi:serine/threonine-protein kinase [Streptomyces sp. G2]|uniref:serine/threonine-protein kinase n=1 Tax=Streptomyces sp. G2 TaxID=1684471 RepID=UPI0035A8F2D4
MTPLEDRRAAADRDEGPELLPPGHRVGAWEVVEPIGAGGWSTVYAARPAVPATAGPARVALKVMPTAGLAPRQLHRLVESARREAALGRRAGHPRLIALLDTFTLTAPDRPSLDGALVLVMERATGSLRDLLDAAGRGRRHDGTPDDGAHPREADRDADREAHRARLAEGICEGLAHLHRSGWVHADLKPENVLLAEDGSVKLSDFGLATELTGTHGHMPPMGTLDYLPPERWRAPLGERGVQVRTTADIWALGIVLHELLGSGVPPFPGATPGARGAAVQEYAAGRAPLRLDPAVPPFWRELVADCLAPTHAARAPHTAEALLARIAARPGARAPAPPPRRGRGRTRAAVLAAALCGAGAALCSDTAGHGPLAAPGAVRVFNAERGCQERTDRDPQCSLGLAIDPHRPYTAENVVRTRVWHGDLLTADCQVPDGEPIVDEEDLSSTRWFRVRLPRGSGPSDAWLPAVRTRDRPELPGCPRTAPGR